MFEPQQAKSGDLSSLILFSLRLTSLVMRRSGFVVRSRPKPSEPGLVRINRLHGWKISGRRGNSTKQHNRQYPKGLIHWLAPGSKGFNPFNPGILTNPGSDDVLIPSAELVFLLESKQQIRKTERQAGG
jgi:hypothetical protein